MGHLTRKMGCLVLGFTLLLSTTLTSTGVYTSNYVDPNDWPMTHRTPDCNRMIPVEIAPEPGELEIAWEYKLEDQKQWVKNFVIADGKLFFNKAENSKTDGVIRCLDATNGKPIWETKTTIDQYTNFISFKGMLFFVGKDKAIYCLDGNTGDVAWEKPYKGLESLSYYDDYLIAIDPENGILAINPYSGDTEWSVKLISDCHYYEYLIYDDFLYIAASSKDYSIMSIYKVNLPEKAGNFVYQFSGEPLYLLNVYDNYLYLTNYSGTVFCINMKTRNVKWTLETKGYLGISKIIRKGDFLYFSEQGSIDFGNIGNSFLCVDGETGEIVWRKDYSDQYISNPIIYGNIVSFGVTYYGLQSLNVFTGETVYTIFKDKTSFILKSISRKMVYVVKTRFYGSSEPDSIVCFKQKVCR